MRKLLMHLVLILAVNISCSNAENDQQKDKFIQESSDQLISKKSHTATIFNEIPTVNEDGTINAIIEITSGTVEKWEIDKTTGECDIEIIDGKPRVIDYLGYPANYGMVPHTVLPKNLGGDGDPLDIIVLGPPLQKEAVVPCTIIGLLKLSDRGEQDDKLIAVSSKSTLSHIKSLKALSSEYSGILDIIEIWFSNYKGPGKMQSGGYGEKIEAEQILNYAIEEYNKSQ